MKRYFLEPGNLGRQYQQTSPTLCNEFHFNGVVCTSPCSFVMEMGSAPVSCQGVAGVGDGWRVMMRDDFATPNTRFQPNPEAKNRVGS